MTDTHAVARDKLAAYALGALDAPEVRGLEAHLRTCDVCQANLATYQKVSRGLLLALPPRAPRPTVKRALRDYLARELPPARQSPRWPRWQFAMAGGIVLLAAITVFSVIQVTSLRQEQAELIRRNDNQQVALAMLAYPNTQTVAFDQNGISGSLLVDKQRGLLAVFAWHLPPAPSGKTYQMWLIDGGGVRTSGGFLVPESGYPFVTAVINSASPISDYTGLGVTVEPLGGSPGPTGSKVLGVDFQVSPSP